MRVDVKPMTVNIAWKGRRYKTDHYKRYEKTLFAILPKTIDIPRGELHLYLTFGFSKRSNDIDNPLKCFIDILQKKYKFNDNRIYKLTVNKSIVSEGSEFIDFEFSSADY